MGEPAKDTDSSSQEEGEEPNLNADLCGQERQNIKAEVVSNYVTRY